MDLEEGTMKRMFLMGKILPSSTYGEEFQEVKIEVRVKDEKYGARYLVDAKISPEVRKALITETLDRSFENLDVLINNPELTELSRHTQED